MASLALELAGGVAAYLAEHDVVSWDDFGAGTAYDSSTPWPTFIGPRMPTGPDALVVVTSTVQARIRADVLQGFQIRLRGDALSEDSEPDPEQINALHDAILAVLYPNGYPLVHATLGNVRVGIVRYLGSMIAETDAAGRLGIMLNFQARARRPRPV
jgi:hypothetical protein